MSAPRRFVPDPRVEAAIEFGLSLKIDAPWETNGQGQIIMNPPIGLAHAKRADRIAVAVRSLLPGAEVELVQPTTDDSGIAKYLAKRGPGMHHLCLEVDDIEEMISQLKAKGVRLINEEPRTAADGKKYAFIHPESTSGVLVELYQI